MGATACGKTALSLRVASALNTDIISVDSALVYRGMNIGTAKPDMVERAGIRHHLIDIVEPWQAYSAARFRTDAIEVMGALQNTGKQAVLAGGTLLYFKALEEGLAQLPDADPAVREALAEQALLEGWPAMHDHLRSVDVCAAQRIHPNDSQRIQRALEVYQLAGISMSELQNRAEPGLATAPLKFALVPSDRAWLHRRIEQRFRTMLHDGFLEEVQRLRQHPSINAQLPAMRSVGYRQAWQYLDEQNEMLSVPSTPGVPGQSETSEFSLNKSVIDEPWVNKAIVATRQLAKRQFTWIRSMSNVTVIACDTLSLDEQCDVVLQHVARS